jgi:septum formation protein
MFRAFISSFCIEMTMLVLASGSPRRKALLTQVGLTFSVEVSDISEDLLPNEQAADYVARLAEEKARAVFARLEPRDREDDRLTVIGADTCVLAEGEILGKPGTRAEARRMLELMEARTHQVLTGVAVVTRAGATVGVEISQVTFDLIGQAEMEAYLDSGEAMDKAGAYGIQGYAARWIPRIDGCFFNVMGLPIARTMQLLAIAKDKLAQGPLDPEATVAVA